VLAAFVLAAAAFVLAAAAFGVAFVFAFETPCANAALDHATDPNNMAATPASPWALANLIVFIVAPRYLGRVKDIKRYRQFLDAARAEV
jgi:hypothetical protein